MFEEKTRIIVEDKYVEMVSVVIDELRECPVQQLQDSMKLSSGNLWDAFVEHMQYEDDELDSVERAAVLEICQRVVHSLTITELKLMWLVSEGALIWEEEEDFPDIEHMVNDVVDELMSWIEQEAEDPELEVSAYEYEDDDENNIYLDDDSDKVRH